MAGHIGFTAPQVPNRLLVLYQNRAGLRTGRVVPPEEGPTTKIPRRSQAERRFSRGQYLSPRMVMTRLMVQQPVEDSRERSGFGGQQMTSEIRNSVRRLGQRLSPARTKQCLRQQRHN